MMINECQFCKKSENEWAFVATVSNILKKFSQNPIWRQWQKREKKDLFLDKTNEMCIVT